MKPLRMEVKAFGELIALHLDGRHNKGTNDRALFSVDSDGKIRGCGKLLHSGDRQKSAM